MLYNTTRNKNVQKTFAEIVCLSNAPCGGLYIPSTIPSLKNDHFADMSYSEIAEKVIGIFTEIPQSDISQIVKQSLKHFANEDTFVVKNLSDNIQVVELFHGPTLSFKDYPMQFLGNIVEHILGQSNQKLNILTATSGDTGSAAIHAFAEKENVKIVVLHPKGKVTEFQRKQMTTCHAKNVLNIAVDGTFDDCQAIVKSITNSNFAMEKNISTVNSINWGRIMMQMVYYIKLLQKRKDSTNIFVPTGNFGNIFACYFLKKCGFDGIVKMFISNNLNNVISDTHRTGTLTNKPAISTISPAIDIAIPSNFERMLYMESGFDSQKIADLYQKVYEKNSVNLGDELWHNFHNHFESASISNEETFTAIKRCYEKYGYIIDPHTAVAFSHFEKSAVDSGIIMSTAHPCKFDNAVFDAIGIRAEVPQSNKGVMEKSEKLEFETQGNVKDVILGFFG